MQMHKFAIFPSMNRREDAEVGAWVALVRAQRVALATVERALKDAQLPPLEWYDVLLELDRGGKLRPRDLQDRLLFAQYNLSRLLDRMETAKLIDRTPCPDDARCQWISATPQGLALRKRMWPVYATAIGLAVGRNLSDADARKLTLLLGKISGGSVDPS